MFAGGGETPGGDNAANNSLNQLAMFQLTNSGGSIDWASLAQQWIKSNASMQMQDNNLMGNTTELDLDASKNVNTNPFATVPDAPPPPSISTGGYNAMNSLDARNEYVFEEKGEADMDMDDEHDDEPSASNTAHNTHVPNVRAMPATGHASNPRWQQNQMPYNDNAIHGKPGNKRNQDGHSWNTWNSNSHAKPNRSKPFAPQSQRSIPSLMNIHVPPPSEIKALPDDHDEPTDEVPRAVLDAAKRKMLPAWIREGLEKMEREKQKVMERDQTTRAGKDNISAKNELDLRDTVKNQILGVTTAKQSESSGNEDWDGDEDDDNSGGRGHRDNVNVVSRARSDNSGSEDEENAPSTSAAAARKAVETGKSYEQKLDDLMINVRRTLTELLLSVTNEQIAKIAHETLKAQKLKATSAQVIRKSALSSITNKLGLAAYSSSSDEDASDDESDRRSAHGANSIGNRSGGEDSEEEIKASLRQKRRAFAKTAEEIEERIADTAMREEQKRKYYKEKDVSKQSKEERGGSNDDDRGYKRARQRSGRNYNSNDDNDSDNSDGSFDEDRRRAAKQTATLFPSMAHVAAASGKSYKRDFGETTTDTYKMHQANGKRQKDRMSSSRRERTTRFSDNKDSREGSVSGAASLICNQLQFPQPQTAAVTLTAGTAAAANSPAAGPSSAAANHLGLDSQSGNPSDYFLSTASSTGLKNVLNAAEAALEKATQQSKSERHKKRRRDSSDESSDRNERRRRGDRGERDYGRNRRTRDYSRDKSDASVSSSESERSSRRRKTSRSYSRSRSRSRDRYTKSSSGSRRYRHHDKNDNKRHYSASASSHRRRDRHYDYSDEDDRRSKKATSSSSSRRKRYSRSRSPRDRSRSHSTTSSTSRRHRH